jgi:hypothetical protein
MDNWENDDVLLNYTELQHKTENNILDMDEQRSTINQMTLSILPIPKMSNDECMKVWNILQSWSLECLYKTCIGKNN